MVQEHDYLLAETAVTVTGVVTYITDQFDTDGENPIERVVRSSTPPTVSLRLRGDIGNGPCKLVIGGRRADKDIQLQYTTDGRILSVQYKSVGVGPRLVSAGASILGTLAGAALRFTPLGAVAGQGTSLAATPDQLANAAWYEKNPELSARRVDAEEQAESTAAQAFTLKVEAAKASSLSEQISKIAQSRRLEMLHLSFVAEVQEIDKRYRDWRITTISSREVRETVEVELRNHATVQKGSSEPSVDSLTGDETRIWNNFGLIVQLEPRRTARPATVPVAGTDTDTVYWRQPELREVSIWRKPTLVDSDATLEQVQSTLEYVVSKDSLVREMPLSSSIWGDDSVTLQFDDSGAATVVSTIGASRVGLVATALGGASAEFSAGLQTFVDIQKNIDALRDSDGSAAKTRLENQLAGAKAELDLVGTEATAADYATLQRLEQKVKIAAAEGLLTPPSASAVRAAEVDRLTKEVALFKALNDLESE